MKVVLGIKDDTLRATLRDIFSHRGDQTLSTDGAVGVFRCLERKHDCDVAIIDIQTAGDMPTVQTMRGFQINVPIVLISGTNFKIDPRDIERTHCMFVDLMQGNNALFEGITEAVAKAPH